ncbi:MAG: DUF1801 domain-containing protein [Saccharospirillum sp.]|nr:DUF1801 domain-containing protein [Saccharospirillum sp.]
MADNKTQTTEMAIEDYLATIEDPQRRQDCTSLVSIMAEITNEPPVLWGTSIVGFGTYHYKYESGREGDFMITGFASRARDISIYLMASTDAQANLLAKLGKHKMGRACLTIKRLSDIDLTVLRELITQSVGEMKRRYPDSP